MNTTNLLEQASEHVKKVNKIMGQVEDFEAVLSQVESGVIALYSKGAGTTFIDTVLNQDDMTELKDIVVARIISARNSKTAELEKLLGRKEEVPQVVAEQSRESVAKPNYPKMTVDRVKELYHDKDMTLEEVAKEFGIPRGTLYTFITNNGLRKPGKKEKETFLDSKIQSKSKKEHP